MTKQSLLNIYYMLAYVHGQLSIGQTCQIGTEDFHSLPTVLVRGLIHHLQVRARQGLGQGYRTTTEELHRPRGKLLFTLPRPDRRMIQCDIDDLHSDTPVHRIVKATVLPLLQDRHWPTTQQRELGALSYMFRDVPTVPLTDRLFANVLRTRLKPSDHLLVEMCRLIWKQQLPTPDGSSANFTEFTGTDAELARLFERFVQAFYRAEQRRYLVRKSRFAWQHAVGTPASLALLPALETDITLTDAQRTIIIDTKFYRDALTAHYGQRRIRSEHLYQLLAYLQNVPTSDGVERQGILLYPFVNQPLDHEYRLNGFMIRVVTIDFTAPWPMIGHRLLDLIEC